MSFESANKTYVSGDWGTFLLLLNTNYSDPDLSYDAYLEELKRLFEVSEDIRNMHRQFVAGIPLSENVVSRLLPYLPTDE